MNNDYKTNSNPYELNLQYAGLVKSTRIDERAGKVVLATPTPERAPKSLIGRTIDLDHVDTLLFDMLSTASPSKRIAILNEWHARHNLCGNFFNDTYHELERQKDAKANQGKTVGKTDKTPKEEKKMKKAYKSPYFTNACFTFSNQPKCDVCGDVILPGTPVFSVSETKKNYHGCVDCVPAIEIDGKNPFLSLDVSKFKNKKDADAYQRYVLGMNNGCGGIVFDTYPGKK